MGFYPAEILIWLWDPASSFGAQELSTIPPDCRIHSTCFINSAMFCSSTAVLVVTGGTLNPLFSRIVRNFNYLSLQLVQEFFSLSSACITSSEISISEAEVATRFITPYFIEPKLFT